MKSTLKLTFNRRGPQAKLPGSTSLYLFVVLLCVLSEKTLADQSNSALKQETELRIAVASNFYSSLVNIVEVFESQSAYRVSISQGSSGLLSSQILMGASFDIFLSADSERVNQLVEQELLLQEDTRVYARGLLLLVGKAFAGHQQVNSPWCSLSEQLESAKHGKALTMALAKPDLAPYGKAGEKLMKTAFPEAIENKQIKLVYGNNVSQVAQYFSQAGVDFAWLPLSMKAPLLKQVELVCLYEPPLESYPEIQQKMALLQKHKPAARAFWQFMASDEVKTMIRSAGYLDGGTTDHVR